MNTALPNQVRTVKPADKLEITEGSLFATEGSWQRKYICTEVISSQDEQSLELHFGCARKVLFHAVKSQKVVLVFLGSYWASGKIKESIRVSEQILTVYTDKDGNTVFTPVGGKYRLAYTHVVVR